MNGLVDGGTGDCERDGLSGNRKQSSDLPPPASRAVIRHYLDAARVTVGRS